jgi:hypothetical protein
MVSSSTHLMVTILLRRRGRLTVAAIVGGLRRGRRLVLLWGTASVSTAAGNFVCIDLLTARRIGERILPAEDRSFAAAEGRNSAGRRGTAGLGSRTWLRM